MSGFSCLPLFGWAELCSKPAGYPPGQESHQRDCGARLCHQEDPLQDGGRRGPALAAAEVVPVLRRHHLHPLHGLIQRVRPGPDGGPTHQPAGGVHEHL